MLDTMIKIEEEASMVMVKPGKKTVLFEIANKRAPGLEEVRQKVLELVTGRTLVGYHTKNKLRDLGIYHLMSLDDILRGVNCSTMFNLDGKTDPQH